MSEPDQDARLRDHFAAAALTGLLVNANNDIDEDTLDTPSDIAYTAYALADAMLRERCSRQAAPDSSPVTEPMPKEKRAEVSAKLVAWAVTGHDGYEYVSLLRECAEEAARSGGGHMLPLYTHPQPTLTAAEREALWFAIAYAANGGNNTVESALRGLLERLK